MLDAQLSESGKWRTISLSVSRWILRCFGSEFRWLYSRDRDIFCFFVLVPRVTSGRFDNDVTLPGHVIIL